MRELLVSLLENLLRLEEQRANEPRDRARTSSRAGVHHRSAANRHDTSARSHQRGPGEPRTVHLGSDVSRRDWRDAGRDRYRARAHAVATRLGEPARAGVHANSSDRARSAAGVHRDPRAGVHGHPVPHDAQRAVVPGLVRDARRRISPTTSIVACCSTCKPIARAIAGCSRRPAICSAWARCCAAIRTRGSCRRIAIRCA